jgi:heme oxygenase (biliverdin-IX-beta and delta-forming)
MFHALSRAGEARVTADFDPRRAAKRLIREARTGALATLLPRGAPYASLVSVATLMDGTPVTLLSRLARHTENIAGDPRVSLMVDERRPGDPLAVGRVSLVGRILPTADEATRRRFLARHPEAAGYAGFQDFAFWRIEAESAHLVAGFGRIVDLSPADLRTDTAGAAALAAAEAGAIAHMNEDHLDALALYATKLLGAPPGEWRIVSLDPEGCELRLGDSVRRLDFPAPVTDGQGLRKTLVALAQAARAVAAPLSVENKG